jgi:protein N-terminal methyltransferase
VWPAGVSVSTSHPYQGLASRTLSVCMLIDEPGQPVPHVEQLSSRLLLLSLLPQLHTFPSPLTPLPPPPAPHRRTALDVGAGIGRVTRHVLLPLFDDVVLLEPVAKFVSEAHRAAAAGEWRDLPRAGKQPETEEGTEQWKEGQRRVEESQAGRGKRVWFVRGGLQGFDPRLPVKAGDDLGVVGDAKVGEGSELGDADASVVYDT